jgi:hypothetical protein
MTISLKKNVNHNILMNDLTKEQKTEMVVKTFNKKSELIVKDNDTYQNYKFLKNKDVDGFFFRLFYSMKFNKEGLKPLNSEEIKLVHNFSKRSEQVKSILAKNLGKDSMLRKRDLYAFKTMVELEENKGKTQQAFVFCIGDKKHKVLTDVEVKKFGSVLEHGLAYLEEYTNQEEIDYCIERSPLARKFLEGVYANNLKLRKKDKLFMDYLWGLEFNAKEQENVKNTLKELMADVQSVKP